MATSISEQEEFFKFCMIVLDVIPKHLRIFFRDRWVNKYGTKWDETAKSGQRLFNKIPRELTKGLFDEVKNDLRNGNTELWDSTSLFFMLQKSGIVIDPCREKAERTPPLRDSEEIDKIREIRNLSFAHAKSAAVEPQVFQDAVNELKSVSKVLFKECSGFINDLKAIVESPVQTTLSHELQKKLDYQKHMNDEYNKYLKVLEERVCVLEEDVKGTKEEVKSVSKTVQHIDEKQKITDDNLQETKEEVKTVTKTIQQMEEKQKNADEDLLETREQFEDFKTGIDERQKKTDENVQILSKKLAVLEMNEESQIMTDESAQRKLKDKYISKCEKHQINYVEGRRIKLAWMNVDEFAVRLKITGLTYCDSSFHGEMTRHVERLQDQSKVINLPDLLYNDHHIMFIQGVAGSGKTVFAKQLALKWTMATDKDEIRKNFKHLIFFECRDFNRYLKNDNIDDVIDSFLREEFFGINIEDGEDSLLLIDGFDEMASQKTGPNSAKSIIEKFISKFPKSKLIILGRPHVQNTFEGLDCKVFEILGLSTVEIEDYVKRFAKFVSQVENHEQLIKKTMKNSENISAITTVPQFLNTLCCVAILTNGQRISTATELYTWTLYLLINQHLHVKDPGGKSGFVSDIFSKYIPLVKSLSAIAFELYINNDIIFEKKKFEHVFEEIKGSDVQQKEFFESLFCDVSDNFGERRQFKHLSIMEFFASIYFFSAEDRNRVIEQFLDKKAYECISFICCFEGRKLVKNFSREDISWALVNVLDREGRETDSPCIIKVLRKLRKLRHLKKTVFGHDANMKLMLKFICDTLNPTDEIKDKSLLTEMLEKITPPERIIMNINEIDQMNIFNVIQTAKNNGVNDDEFKKFFKGIELKVKYLEYVKVIQFACLFDCVEITLVEKELSEDDVELLSKHAVYCRKVSFESCDFTEGTYLWQELLKHIKEHESDMRLEIFDMQIGDECIDSFSKVLIMLKEVELNFVTIDKAIWDNLFYNIVKHENDHGHLRLERLQIVDMEIADECIDSFSNVFIMLKEVKLIDVSIDKAKLPVFIRNAKDKGQLNLQSLTINDHWPRDIRNKIEEAGVNVVIDDDPLWETIQLTKYLFITSNVSKI